MLEAVLGGLVFFLVFAWVFAAFFVWIGGKMAGIEKATFGRSMMVALANVIVVGLVSTVLSVVPVVGTVLGFFVGLLFTLLIIKGVFETTFGKAFLAWVFNVVAHVAALVLVLILGLGGAATMM
jgi:hypothetical protein